MFMAATEKSSSILNASTNLLGFCLVVLTSLKVSNYGELTLIDEFTGISCLLLVISTASSFLSLRTKAASFAMRYEKIADIVFIVALLPIFTVVLIIAFSFLI